MFVCVCVCVCVCVRACVRATYVAYVRHSDGMAILRQNVRFLHILKCALPILVGAIFSFETTLTLILLTWRIWWVPNDASRWQIGFNSAFKGLIVRDYTTLHYWGSLQHPDLSHFPVHILRQVCFNHLVNAFYNVCVCVCVRATDTWPMSVILMGWPSFAKTLGFCIF